MGFEKIRPNQSFYITADHRLIISLDKYEVAPGSMGIFTFEIPTKVVKELLVGDMYSK